MKRREFLKSVASGVFCAFSPGFLAGCVGRAGSGNLSLRQRVGQMMLVGFRGVTLTANDPIVRDIVRYGIGGVVLFDYDAPSRRYGRNISSPGQLAALTSQLASLSSAPLLIAVDQEGGRVARLKKEGGFPPTVSAQALGEKNDLAYTRQQAGSIAATLKGHGLNLNFAPVVDLNLNPDNPVIGRLERSFSSDPGCVVSHAVETIRAHDRHGVLTCLKHFPGHGSSRADSHQGFVDVTASWRPAELEPYRKLIREGLARMVMTAHIYNRRLDPVYPATLSRSTITGLLRNRLGFDGVVVSDDLQMGAISQNFPYEVAVEKTISAGVDILLVANNSEYDPDVAPKTVELICGLVRRGVIPEERIDASWRRILKLKSGMKSLPQEGIIPLGA